MIGFRLKEVNGNSNRRLPKINQHLARLCFLEDKVYSSSISCSSEVKKLNPDVSSSSACRIKAASGTSSWTWQQTLVLADWWSYSMLSLRLPLLDVFDRWLSVWAAADRFHVWKSKRAWLSFSIQSSLSCLVSAENQHLTKEHPSVWILRVQDSTLQACATALFQTYLANASWLSSCCWCGTLLTSSKVNGRAHESLLTGLTHWLGELDREMLPSASWRLKQEAELNLLQSCYSGVRSAGLAVGIVILWFHYHWDGSSSTWCMRPGQNIGDATPHSRWSIQTSSGNIRVDLIKH